MSEWRSGVSERTDGEDEDWNIVLPFVVTDDNGGSYDADGFVAGFNVGVYWTRMFYDRAEIVEWVDRGILDQLDLMAMHHGFAMVVADDDEDDPNPFWALVTLSPLEQVDNPEQP